MHKTPVELEQSNHVNTSLNPAWAADRLVCSGCFQTLETALDLRKALSLPKPLQALVSSSTFKMGLILYCYMIDGFVNLKMCSVCKAPNRK